MTWPLTLPTGTVYFHEKPMGVFGSAAPSFGKNLPASRGWERKLMRRSAADVAAKPITGDFGVDGGDQSGVASMAFARSSTLCVMRIALDIGRDPESSEPRPHGGDPAALGDVGERGDGADEGSEEGSGSFGSFGSKSPTRRGRRASELLGQSSSKRGRRRAQAESESVLTAAGAIAADGDSGQQEEEEPGASEESDGLNNDLSEAMQKGLRLELETAYATAKELRGLNARLKQQVGLLQGDKARLAQQVEDGNKNFEQTTGKASQLKKLLEMSFAKEREQNAQNADTFKRTELRLKEEQARIQGQLDGKEGELKLCLDLLGAELAEAEASTSNLLQENAVQRVAAKGLGVVYVSQLYPLKKELARLREKEAVDQQLLETFEEQLMTLQQQKDETEASLKKATETLIPLQSTYDQQTAERQKAEELLAATRSELAETKEQKAHLEAQTTHLVAQLAKADVNVRRLGRERDVARKRESQVAKATVQQASRADMTARVVGSMASRVLNLEKSFGSLVPAKLSESHASLIKSGSGVGMLLAASESQASFSPTRPTTSSTQRSHHLAFSPSRLATPSLGAIRPSSSTPSLMGRTESVALWPPSGLPVGSGSPQGATASRPHSRGSASPSGTRPTSRGFTPGQTSRPSRLALREQVQQQSLHPKHEVPGTTDPFPLLTPSQFQDLAMSSDDVSVTAVATKAAHASPTSALHLSRPSSRGRTPHAVTFVDEAWHTEAGPW